MRYVFGPVPSRRLGRSLGVDPIPFKSCNWNCVYCQLGRSTPMTGERRDHAPEEAILAQLEEALAGPGEDGVDWITFVGSGEPTLHVGLGRLIRAVKARTTRPVAVITNGSLLYLAEVREALAPADAVLPSLDAGSPALYREIDRALGALTFERLVEGLVAFRRGYAGALWVEVMLLAGVNDTPEALRDLAAVLARVAPDEVHLNLPVRPPAEPWVAPAGAEGIALAQATLGPVARVVTPAPVAFELGGGDDPGEAALGVITRHPMREPELIGALRRWPRGEVERALLALVDSGRAQVVEHGGERFWSGGGAVFGGGR